MPTYDYVPLDWPRCQYPVEDPSQPEGERECSRPAFWRMWWGPSSDQDTMLLCTEHWRQLIQIQGDSAPVVDPWLESDQERPMAF